MSEAEARSWAILVAAIGAMVVGIINAWRGTRVEKKVETVEAKVAEHEAKATTRAILRGDPVPPEDV